MLSDNQKEKLKKAILEGKVTDKTTLQIFNMVSDLEEKVESLTNDLKLEVEKSVAEVKASEISLDKVLESVKGKDAVVDYPKIIQEVVTLIPPPKDGISPIIDYKKIIDEVVSKIPTPKDGISPVVDYEYIISQIPIPKDGVNGQNGKEGSPDTGEQIVEKINDLPTDEDELKIDASHIKNLPKMVKNEVGGVVARNIYQMGDVSLTNLANDQVLKWDDTNKLWVNGTGGGAGTIDGSGSANTLAFWSDADTLTYDAHLTYDAVNDVLHVHKLAGDATDGLILESANGTDIGILGAGNTANVTWYGNHNFNTVTASRVAQFGASKTLESSSVTNTELGYLSGVTSAIQTQLNAKGVGDALTSGALTQFVGNNTWKIFYSDGSGDIQELALGAAGKVLQANGVAAAPTWETVSGGSGITRTQVTTSGSITLGATASTDYVYYVAGAHTLSMPSPNNNRYTIKNNHSANITIDTAGAELIEGATSISIAPGSSVDIVSDTTNWFIV